MTDARRTADLQLPEIIPWKRLQKLAGSDDGVTYRQYIDSMNAHIEGQRTGLARLQKRNEELVAHVRFLSKYHPDYNTPNWCERCTPAGIGYCRCEIASNE